MIMCVNQLAVMNVVTSSKGKEDDYRGFISDVACFKCGGGFSSDNENKDIWKNTAVRHNNHIRPDTPNSVLKKLRKSARKLSQHPGGRDDFKAAVSDTRTDEQMSLLQFLAINALNLSAPASDLLFKTRGSTWFQLSGHPDSLAPAGPGTVWKKRPSHDDAEKLVYEELSQDRLLRDIIPKYHREVEHQGEHFIELQDLLHGFQDPYVMDIKMGTRTFLESEVANTNTRSDLYQKMVAIDPTAPTAEEHERGAVTKLRYMQFRETQSSTCSLGFRIEAVKCRGSPPVTDLKKIKGGEEVAETLRRFLGPREQVRRAVSKRLIDIRRRIEESDYFRSREVVGSSLFVIFDDSKVGVWLIDFAKTRTLPVGVAVDHRRPWVQGNHEEGFLFGLDRLISIIDDIKIPVPKKSSINSLSKFFPPVSVKS